MINTIKFRYPRDFYVICCLFFLITLIKIFISFNFKSPWIFADETVYAETARNILQGEFFSHLINVQTYPPGYSILLSIVYVLFGEGIESFQYMLILNTIITSSILFPAYFILRKFSSVFLSYIGAILIAVLPSVVLYNFVIMSENLFITLVMFSLWFLIEACEKDSKYWFFLTGITLFSLYFTRLLGMAMIIGLIGAVIYYFKNQYNNHQTNPVSYNFLVSIIAFIIPLLVWSFYKYQIGLPLFSSGYSGQQGFIQVIFSNYSDIQFIVKLLYLLFHEIEYIILSSYFIFFFLTILFVYFLFSKNFDSHNESIVCIQKNNFLPLKTGFIYFLISTSITVGGTIAHMSSVLFRGENESYYIFGRYIDPVIPIFFLFGLIGLYLTIDACKFNRKGVLISTVFFLLPITIFFLIDFPTKKYKLANMFGIFYIQNMISITPIYYFIAIFAGIVGFLFILVLHRKKLLPVFLFLFIIFSIFINFLTIPVLLHNSEYTSNNLQIADYVTHHSDGTNLISMSSDEYKGPGGVNMFYLTQFFVKDLLVVNTSTTKTVPDYILSKTFLPYPIIERSKNRFKLYDVHAANEKMMSVPYIIDNTSEINCTSQGNLWQYEGEGWSDRETDYTWTEGSNVSVILSLDQPPELIGTLSAFAFTGPGLSNQTVRIAINHKELPDHYIMNSKRKTVSIPIPSGYLINGTNSITLILPDATSPHSLGISQDERKLGLAIKSITLSEKK